MGTAVIIGAIIGAIVGGIAAALRGGDVFEGMVVGAIGGAITSAISFGATSWLSSSGTVAAEGSKGYLAQEGTRQTTTQQVVDSSVRTKMGTMADGTIQSTGGAGAGGEFSWGAMFDSMFTGQGASTLAQGALAIGGNILSAQDAAKEAEKQREFQAQQAAENRQAQMEMQQMAAESSESQLGAKIASEERMFNQDLAERRRQFDVPLQKQEEMRQRQGGVLAGIQVARKAYETPTAPSIDEQVAASQQGLLNLKQGEVTEEEEVANA